MPIWILGSSLFGAQLAAAMGLPFAFASHFAPTHMMEAIEIYRAEFKPSKQLAAPYVMVGVPALFHRSCFDALLTLPDSTGAKAFILSRQLEVASIPFARGEIDIDTPEDFQRLIAQSE